MSIILPFYFCNEGRKVILDERVMEPWLQGDDGEMCIYILVKKMRALSSLQWPYFI